MSLGCALANSQDEGAGNNPVTSTMETRAHPTHHSHYRPKRTAWGVVVSVAGVFLCVFIAMVDSGGSRVLHVVKLLSLAAGALAFVGGTLLAAITELPHAFARCPSCGRL